VGRHELGRRKPAVQVVDRYRPAGALGGQMDGLVTDVGLTYVPVQTDEGPALLPNVQALGAIVLTIPDRPATPAGSTIPRV
jgi:hypothetical protein